MKINYTLYLFLFFIIVIFFIYGLLLSEVIDYIFPTYETECDEYRLALEIVGEIGVAYLIYFSLKNYKDKLIDALLKNIFKTTNRPSYLNELLIIAFSFGIYRHLQKSTEKIKHFRRKYANPILKKIPYCDMFITS